MGTHDPQTPENTLVSEFHQKVETLHSLGKEVTDTSSQDNFLEVADELLDTYNSLREMGL